MINSSSSTHTLFLATTPALCPVSTSFLMRGEYVTINDSGHYDLRGQALIDSSTRRYVANAVVSDETVGQKSLRGFVVELVGPRSPRSTKNESRPDDFLLFHFL
ncbi:hypothetical protein D9619_008956 [Psilocybe cf. subviscida]|uniref:Uncharacterized protein n=1 Tax=Psilocybe cf. subviscida TaxID=2480587 RepID=A0A8H5BTS0_9AGAR|nr:hypothetical protein D9619_008956 [Psilocybe cf. subviscida]